MTKTESIIDGFEFVGYEEAMRAAKEIEGVNYIRQKTNMENPYMVLQIYNKMVSQKMFETPVGYSFLKELQNYLYDSPVIADDEIRPIRIEPTAVYAEELPKEEKKEEETDRLEETEKSLRKVTEKTRELRKIVHAYKQRCFVLSFVSVILAVSVVAMCVIAGTGKSVTILNYENKLIDKYEAWEQELEQREAAVKERESQLGQN